MNTMNERFTITENHHYIYNGERYESRLECKEAIAKGGVLKTVNTTLFNNLLAIGVVQKFK